MDRNTWDGCAQGCALCMHLVLHTSTDTAIPAHLAMHPENILDTHVRLRTPPAQGPHWVLPSNEARARKYVYSSNPGIQDASAHTLGHPDQPSHESRKYVNPCL